MKNSKTAQAIAWIIAEPGRSQYRAAQLFKVSQSAISIGMKKREQNVELWKEYGARIEAGDTRGIPHRLILRAMRGRDDGAGAQVSEVSRTQQALDYMAVTGCSAPEAAAQYRLQAATLYPAQKRERYMAGEFERYGASLIDELATYAAQHPAVEKEFLAAKFGIRNQYHVPAFIKLRDTYARREAMRAAGVRAIGPNRAGREDAVKECVAIARAMGGPFAEQFVVAFESLLQ